MNLNLVVFGSSIVSACWNGAATYYRGMCRALRDHSYATRAATFERAAREVIQEARRGAPRGISAGYLSEPSVL